METLIRTYNGTGLNNNQILLLDELDRMWFEGEDIKLNTIKKAMETTGVPKGQDIMDAWDFWRTLRRPYFRSSLIEPIQLSDLVEVNENGMWFRGNETKYSLKDNLADRMGMLKINGGWYLEMHDNRLYIKYNTIIGSRYIANVKNDLI